MSETWGDALNAKFPRLCGEFFRWEDEEIDDDSTPLTSNLEWLLGLPDKGKKICVTFTEAVQAAEAKHPELFKENNK